MDGAKNVGRAIAGVVVFVILAAIALGGHSSGQNAQTTQGTTQQAQVATAAQAARAHANAVRRLRSVRAYWTETNTGGGTVPWWSDIPARRITLDGNTGLKIQTGWNNTNPMARGGAVRLCITLATMFVDEEGYPKKGYGFTDATVMLGDDPVASADLHYCSVRNAHPIPAP